jgi:two-component system sensor histidine kinase MprB
VLATRFARPGFQARLTLVAAAAVALAVAIAAVVIYVVVRGIVLAQVDDSIKRRAEGTRVGEQTSVQASPTRPGVLEVENHPVIVPAPDPGGADGIIQAVRPDGTVVISQDQLVRLPVSDRDQLVASGYAAAGFRDDRVNGKPYRIYTEPFVPGYALEVGRPLSESLSILRGLELVLGAIAASGVVLAGILGWFIAKAGLRPIHRLRAAVDHVTDTGDMSQRVREGEDELGRLGAHFNRMLAALDQSLRTQRQLVADASHELRTPLASLRTNIEVLQRSPGLPLGERSKLLGDVVAQIEQLTRLISDLIDLARGDQTPEQREEVRLDWIVAFAVERAAVNWPRVRFAADLRESTVVAQASRLDRAISNLLDNAGKWSPPGDVVEVQVVDHEVTVRDHGPGIDAADLPYVFDRFWRAPAARALPGSGLGLSIVRQVAETHHATVTAELPEDGGTLMRFKFSDS